MNIRQKVSSAFRTASPQARTITAVLAVAVILVALPLTLTLVQTQQDNRQFAADNRDTKQERREDRRDLRQERREDRRDDNKANTNTGNTTNGTGNGSTGTGNGNTGTGSGSSGDNPIVGGHQCLNDGPTKECVFERGNNGNTGTGSGSNTSPGGPEPKDPETACIDMLKVCSDGSTVGAEGPDCHFAACPGEESGSTTGGEGDGGGDKFGGGDESTGDLGCGFFMSLFGCSKGKDSGGGTGGKKPTATPKISTTKTPTSAATGTPAGSTRTFALELVLHGIGSGGDLLNQGGGNHAPKTPERTVHMLFLDAQNKPAGVGTGTVKYDTTSGTFKGTVSLPLTAGAYTTLISVDNYIQSTPRKIIQVQ